MSEKRPPSTQAFEAASPLWSRAPSRDESGRPYIDFMMLIPGLKKADAATVEGYLQKIREALKEYGDTVVYLDLNIKLSLLWVSAKPLPGITKTLVQAILQKIPHAKVVAGDFNPENFVDKKPQGIRALGQRVLSRLRLAYSPTE